MTIVTYMTIALVYGNLLARIVCGEFRRIYTLVQKKLKSVGKPKPLHFKFKPEADP